jgi:hypothetical protein
LQMPVGEFRFSRILVHIVLSSFVCIQLCRYSSSVSDYFHIRFAGGSVGNRGDHPYPSVLHAQSTKFKNSQ